MSIIAARGPGVLISEGAVAEEYYSNSSNTTPAGVVGSASVGKAFVPISVNSIEKFEEIFGNIDGTKFGPMAVHEWLRFTDNATFIRVLGIGDGKRRSIVDGTVTNAGFVVGQREPGTSGILENNIFANPGGAGEGRIYFLGCFLSESNGGLATTVSGSTVFSDAGFATSADKSHPIIRGVIMAASGVIPTLSCSNNVISSAPITTDNSSTLKGYTTGTMNLITGNQEFVLLLNGMKSNNVITASFDITSGAKYFAGGSSGLNMDPLKINEKGHVLYTSYNIDNSFAVVTGSGLTSGVSDANDCVFIVSSSLGRNIGSSTVPNFENFQNRFTTPSSPWIISQKFSGEVHNLFKIHALSDGENFATKYRYKIYDLVGGTNDVFGSFKLSIEDFSTGENIRTFTELSLDPTSERYISRQIGDQNIYYDFDKDNLSQNIVGYGNNINLSLMIRIEVSNDVENSYISPLSLPVGFRGHRHLVTSGSSILAGTDILRRAVVPPIPMRENLGLDRVRAQNYSWGVQFENKTLSNINGNGINPIIENFTKYFPDFEVSNQSVWAGDNAGTANVGGTVLDSDKFNNNMFTLENIQVATGSDTNMVSSLDADSLAKTKYVRAGNIVQNESQKTRAWKTTDIANNQSFAKFKFFMQGGFDGIDIFDKQSSLLLNDAIKGEQDDVSRGLRSGNITSSYKKSLDIIKESTYADIKILAIPGIRHKEITDYAINVAKDRFDVLYIMDIEEINKSGSIIMSGTVDNVVDYKQTATAFNNRDIDSSFAAAYFPNVGMKFNIDGTDQSISLVPPSVALLGVISSNDSTNYTHTAPAGFGRGKLDSLLSIETTLDSNAINTLYKKRINPLKEHPGAGPIVYGQKTLQKTASALDRINVRRMMIDIRRKARFICLNLIFEQNTKFVRLSLTSQLSSILSTIQNQGGIEDFRVSIEEETSQVDIENNVIRGKMFIKPSSSDEFITLDVSTQQSGDEE